MPAAILIVIFLCVTIPIQPTEATVATIPVIVITENATKALVDAGNGNLTFYQTIEQIIQDGDIVKKSVIPAHFIMNLTKELPEISPQHDSNSILIRNLTEVSARGTFFFNENGIAYGAGGVGNKTLHTPTRTIEIHSLGVNLQITYNSTLDPIVISNQYSQLFGVIAIIDAPAPTTTPNVPEYPIAAIILLLILIPLIAHLYIRKIKVKARIQK
jgi:hypothetical protein